MVRDAPAFKLCGGVEIELLASPIPKCSTLKFSTNVEPVQGGVDVLHENLPKKAEVPKARANVWHGSGFWRCQQGSTR